MKARAWVLGLLLFSIENAGLADYTAMPLSDLALASDLIVRGTVLTGVYCAPCDEPNAVAFVQDGVLNGAAVRFTLLHQPDRYPKYHLFGVQDGNEIRGAGFMTPPHPLGLTELPAAGSTLP